MSKLFTGFGFRFMNIMIPGTIYLAFF